MTVTATVHPFSESGLGEAPFKVTGFHEKWHYPVTDISGEKVLSERKPAGTCDHCATGIAYCYEITSADGKTFVVGGTCASAADPTLADQIATTKHYRGSDHKAAETSEAIQEIYDFFQGHHKAPDSWKAGMRKCLAREHAEKITGRRRGRIFQDKFEEILAEI